MASYEDCTLCPRECHADRRAGGIGACGQGSVPLVARASLHFWEEPCISGRTGSGTVFFCGCSLGCCYCQNAAISGPSGPLGSPGPPGRGWREMDDPALAELFLALEDQGACNINLVTPTHFAPTLADAIGKARSRGLAVPIAWNTSGYETVETLRRLEGLVDIYLTDCKYVSSRLSAALSGAPDYFRACAPAIAEMVRQTGPPRFVGQDGVEMDAPSYNEVVCGEEEEASDYAGPLMCRGVIVRHLLLPGQGEDSRRVVEWVLDTFADGVYLSLMSQYTPMPQVRGVAELDRRVTAQEYESLVDYALELGLENGFFQGAGTDEASFIPDF